MRDRPPAVPGEEGGEVDRDRIEVQDRIEVRDLRVMGVHGVLEEERQRAQPFALDLDVDVDVAGAAASDALGDTVDYGALCQRAASVVSGESFRLLEALADRVARAVLDADVRVVGVTVTVRKIRPPIALQVGSVGVKVVRRRPPTTRAR